MKKEKYLVPETEEMSMVTETTFICSSGENLGSDTPFDNWNDD